MPNQSNVPETVVRPMEAGDIAKALRLWRETEGVEVAEGDRPSQLKAYLRRNPGCSFVATKGTQLLGAVLAGHDGRRGMLYHLAVRRKARGRGLGGRLVDKALGALKTAGIKRILILVDKENDEGASFWTKRRWEPIAGADPYGVDL